MKARKKKYLGFTLVELLTIVVVIALIATISYVTYNSWQRSLADKTVRHDGFSASSSLETYRNNKNFYPSNLAGTGFAATNGVALKFMTNASQTPYYESLELDQNAQLLLNSCNAYMPIASGETILNTVCEFAGNNFHVKGQVSSNIVLQGPEIARGDFILTCGPECDTVQANIIAIFEQQGGSWPITVPKKQVPLPEPTLIPIENTATKYCLEATSVAYTDIVYYTTPNQKTPIAGVCPEDPELRYP